MAPPRRKPAPLPKLAVREAREGDLDALARLWRVLDEHHARLAPPGWFAAPMSDTIDRLALARLLVDPHAAILVVLDGDEHVAAAQLQLFETPRTPGMVARRRAYVERVVVAATARRRGVGRRLMEAAVAWARARGAAQIALTVWDGNDDAAAFYRALGWKPLNAVLGLDL